jgi:hypothetical protein
MTAPLGLCRTYLLVDEPSAAGALDAIRRGRTVATDPHGRFYGQPAHVEAVEKWLAGRPIPGPGRGERTAALAALAGLAGLALPSFRRRRKFGDESPRFGVGR